MKKPDYPTIEAQVQKSVYGFAFRTDYPPVAKPPAMAEKSPVSLPNSVGVSKPYDVGDAVPAKANK